MPDPLCYSSHAVARCLERGIIERKVVETVLSGVCISDNGNRAVYARGCMRVVVVRDSRVIVTAYREHKGNPKRNIRKARAAQKKHKRRWA